ncbi:helix-turn-helix transcriptional regulator [Rhodococcus sp. 008]|uniref:helix-turn-helix transcriptional regulator n=1 Tax=Rhodococcus sp. 008 TaxID=1723645 RepID=UPI00080621FA|nr:AraC family transcriptional regulator [Rhodococcus sp. 008]ANQ71912.1 AraC family transcriptional regulator [Rhodococcus sp. 008]
MTWSGAVHMEPGILMFTGAVGSAHMHSHAAVQIMIIDDGDVTVTDGDGDGHSEVVRSVVIPSGAVHALSASEGARGRAIYIDSTTGMGLRIRPAEPGRGGVADWSDRGQTAVAMTDRGADSDLEYAARLIDSLSESRQPSSVRALHPALEHALTLLHERLSGPITLTDTAALVSISPGRLGRIFNDQLQMSFSTYIRWLRLRRAMEVMSSGATLTTSAHEAGFTDSAHLNRICHSMFGLTPSAATGGLTWN